MAYPGYESYAAPDPYAYAGYGATAYGAPPMAAGYGASDELRTVFITGFPTDVKERELNNLLRFIPGYEASQMNWKAGQAQGFALFVNGAAARAACDQIAGLCFDDNVHLRAEMAHKNMYIKDDTGGPKRPRVTGSYTGTATGSYGGGAPARAGPVSYAPVSNTKDNPPCNTLFIGNLSDTVDDSEVQALFATQPGFLQFKVLRGTRNISCFVEFDTVENAMQCHTTQQGAVLRSSDRGPIRIQFSKNPFGKKRDINGQMIDTTQGGVPIPESQAAALTTATSYNAGVANSVVPGAYDATGAPGV